MDRRRFLELTSASALSLLAPLKALPFQGEKSKMKITSVRVVNAHPAHPLPAFKPSSTAWSTQGVEVASPMSIYPDYKAMRSLFSADPGNKDVGSFIVEITTDKGIKGYGQGGPAGGFIVTEHLTKLLLSKDPFDVELLWDQMWRSTMSYGRMGAVVHAISGADLAIWDLIGKALGQPVYKLLGGETKQRIPSYCTGNDVEQHLKFGFKRVKLAIPHGPADGREGMRKNLELVKRTRDMVGPDGDIMLDCWMSWTERYTLEMADLVAPYRVYWMEECLQPHDYDGFGRLNAAIKSTRIATGEHEYTRYGFRYLLEHKAAQIWQPDIHWCGGLTELRRIGALAAAYDIPVIPHTGGVHDCVHWIMATPNAPWAELFMPSPGGPASVYKQWEEEYSITRGPEGIYTRPSDKPGFGMDWIVS
jgi:L-rhamnonate dehydratase